MKWIAILAVANLALIAAGLGRGGPSRRGGHRLKVGLVLDIGGLGDKSFNDAAYKGLVRAAQDLDIETRFIEPGDGSEREAALRQLATSGTDIVFGVGFIFTDDIRNAANRFPKVKFGCIDYAVVPGAPAVPPNLVALRFHEEQGSFLVGALAALVSKTQKIGFVGGMDIPLIHKFEAGYRAGALHVCPTCAVYAAYAGTEPKAFADPTTGKELALAQYSRGADIIFHAAGKTGIGVFNAAQALGKLAIGVDADQFHEMPCCVLTSMVKGVDVAVYDTIKATAAGTFKGGVQELGLAEDGVGYIYDDHNAKWIPAEVHAKVEDLKKEIIAGKIQVPAS